MNQLFVYGTLLYSDIQLKIINRTCIGDAAILYNYKRSQVIKQHYPGIIPKDESIVHGYVIQVNDEELLLLDDYEGDEYSLIHVQVMCHMEMMPVLVYVYKYPQKLQGDWHLEIERLPLNKIIISGEKSEFPLPSNASLYSSINNNTILYTFPNSTIHTKYATIEYVDEYHPVNTPPNTSIDPWSYFHPTAVFKRFVIYFTKNSHVSLNMNDMIALGCRNNDIIQLTMSYNINFFKVQLDKNMPHLGIKIPQPYSDFIRCQDTLHLMKIDAIDITSIELTILSPIEPFELEFIKSQLIDHIIAYSHSLFTVYANNHHYYLKWTAITPNSNHLYYKITKQTRIYIIQSKAVEPFFKIKKDAFTRTIHESVYTPLAMAVIGHTEEERLEFIKRHINYTPCQFIHCQLDLLEIKQLESIIGTCKQYNKLLLCGLNNMDRNDLTHLDALRYLKIHSNAISILFSSKDVDLIPINVHYTTRIDDYCIEHQHRMQSKAWFTLPKSLSFLSLTELHLLDYQYKETMLSYILHGKRLEHDVELWHFDKTPFMRCLHSILKSKTKIPKVYWQDIGGLEEIKRTIVNIIDLPLAHPDYFVNKKQSGILLYGPPGCGKTLVAKAIATECQLNFKSIKGPELLNQYIGESEHNIRLLFEEAKQLAPCVLFFDEIDALAPKRGIHGDSSGVMDRLVSQLLGELDEVAEMFGVVVIGATNRPDLLDNALLRPGRFDSLIYLGPCEEDKQVKSILHAQLKRYTMLVNMDKIVAKIPLPVTGADLFGFINKAIEHAIDRMIKNNIDDALQLTELDFEYSLDTFKSSLTTQELNKYEALKGLQR